MTITVDELQERIAYCEAAAAAAKERGDYGSHADYIADIVYWNELLQEAEE